VVSLQNGVSNEREVLRRFPRVYGVCVMLPSTHLEPGVVVQKCHPTPGILDLGRIPGGTDEVTDAVAADLRGAGFESVPRPDILAWKYRKLVLNLGNGVDAACRPGEAAEELVRRARQEAEQVLEAAGIKVVTAAEDSDRRGDLLRPRSGEGIRRGGSTWQSVTRGAGNVEIDHLSGEIVLLGRWHGVATPVNELVQRTTHALVRRGGPARSMDAEDLLARLP
jgi:2-dehydropantoate 2-reductase